MRTTIVMTEILRFATLRPVPAASVLTLTSGTLFQSQLEESLGAGDQELAATLARQLRESDFVSAASGVARGDELLDFLARLRESEVPAAQELRQLASQAVGAGSPDALAGDLARVRDSVVAAYLLDDDASGDVALELVRAFEVATAALTEGATPARIQDMLSGPRALPEFLTHGARAQQDEQQQVEELAQGLADQINELAIRHDRLGEALGHLNATAEDELELSEAGTRTALTDHFRSTGDREVDRLEPGERRSAAREGAWEPANSPLLRASLGRNVVLSSRAIELMPSTVMETVRSLDLDPAETALGVLHADLTKTLDETDMQLMKATSHYAELAGGLTGVAHAAALKWHVDPVDAPDTPPPLAVAAPGATPTPVLPLGVADLLLVQAHVNRYERSEVAEVVNVLANESLSHTLRHLDTSETTSSQDTERSDLKSVTQDTAEQSSGHTTVQAVGPGVGPLAAEGPSSFAKSVTDQVSSTSTSRTRRQLVERRLRESEDTSQHVLENAGAQTAYGVYQWLDEVYEARTFNYGSRLLYDVIVPEPAATFREAIGRPRSGLPMPVRPAPFTVRPEELTSFNWAYYATGHHATGVDAPPADQVVVSEAFAKQPKDPFSSDAATNTVTWAEARTTRIPKGYRATRYVIVVMSSSYPAGLASVSVGTKTIRLAPANGTFVKTGRLDGERESVPVAVHVTSNSVDWGVFGIAVAIEIICEATDELTGAWQVKTHGQIVDANRSRFQEFAEAAATRDATARLTLQAMQQGRKVGIVSTEVKRTALAYLTGQSFAGFNATAVDASGFPYPNATATGVLAAYIRFLEQAIEWDHIAYAFLPYFWGAQTSWVSKLVAVEPDRSFADFLTSGAARVVLPVRPGYETAFERFLQKGTVPTTQQMLDVGGPLWVSLTDQLRTQATKEGELAAVGEAWEFRIATDLVRARTDGSMPRWTFGQGAWTDAADPTF